jgi:hypothetical protein
VAEEEPERLSLTITPEARQCIEATSECYSVVTETLSYSLDGKAHLSDPAHLRLLIDGAEICQTTQNALLRGSTLGTMLAAVCVEACEKLAETCRRLDGSDEQLTTCAEMCDETAESCRQLAI